MKKNTKVEYYPTAKNWQKLSAETRTFVEQWVNDNPIEKYKTEQESQKQFTADFRTFLQSLKDKLNLSDKYIKQATTNTFKK